MILKKMRGNSHVFAETPQGKVRIGTQKEAVITVDHRCQSPGQIISLVDVVVVVVAVAAVDHCTSGLPVSQEYFVDFFCGETYFLGRSGGSYWSECLWRP